MCANSTQHKALRRLARSMSEGQPPVAHAVAVRGLGTHRSRHVVLAECTRKTVKKLKAIQRDAQLHALTKELL